LEEALSGIEPLRSSVVYTPLPTERRKLLKFGHDPGCATLWNKWLDAAVQRFKPMLKRIVKQVQA
jgi:hypothetical protein